MRRHPSYHYGPDNPRHPVQHAIGANSSKNGTRYHFALRIRVSRTLAPRAFVSLTALGAVILLGLVWLWALAMPLAFLDPEYPAWRAKQILLANCDLGETIVLGDSRAATAMMPARWQSRATNLAVGGGEPIEALAALNRALRCPVPPSRVILSFDVVHFTDADLFWERPVRFGFIDAEEVENLRDASLTLGDPSVYEANHTDGLPAWIRDAMYRVGFPSVYFASLVKGGLLLRWPRNEAILRASIASRGQYFFGTAAGSDTVAAEGHLRSFQPKPVLSWYFNSILDLLNVEGVPAVFIAVPTNEATARRVSLKVRSAFRAWLSHYEARYPGFRVAGDVMPYWPDTYFGDGFAHLNRDGATLFSYRLGRCLNEPTLTISCIKQLQDAP